MDRKLNFVLKVLLIVLMMGSLAACLPVFRPDVENIEANTSTAADPEQGGEMSETTAGFSLVWQDDFDGDQLNPENWTYDLGGGGWGNHELQTYTSDPQNARVENGHLIIEAIKHESGTRKYTSARIKTEGLHAFTYGRIEARIKLPYGQGIWSAFWMLGEDFPNRGWPNCGEIDILENIGRENTIYGTVHGPGYSGGGGVGGSYISSDFEPGEFHVYAIEWEPNEIRWYVDDINYFLLRPSDVPGQWVYDHPFFIIMNLAVGGDWPGPPNDSTEFPQQMIVDYVRVYQSDDPENAMPVAGGEMIVDTVTLTILEKDGERQGEIFVRVVNLDGDPVEGARVSGGWLGVVRKGDTNLITDNNGIAGPFLSEATTTDGEISFCVTSVVGGGYAYDKTNNNQTCAFSEP
jgi:beta-glucanase (GH16 family)